MQISCADCHNISSTSSGDYPVLQAWCVQCQKPTVFLPVFSGNYDFEHDYDLTASVSLSQFQGLLDGNFEQTSELIVSCLGGTLAKDNLGNWVLVTHGQVSDLKWVYDMLRRHSVWWAQVYNLAMNTWR
jgi:hypothetical protein